MPRSGRGWAGRCCLPIDWPFPAREIRLAAGHNKLLLARDGERQEATARAILDAFRSQPGVILADEVGMGKTYVALAVIASVLLATRKEGRPILVMMPPGLKGKWPRDWRQFRQLYCPEGAFDWVRDEFAASPAELFRLLDDHKAKRAHLIWATTSCFHGRLTDPWIKLAFVRFARSRTKMDREDRKRLYRYVGDLVRLKSRRSLWDYVYEQLLGRAPDRWKDLLVEWGVLGEAQDEPVPKELLKRADELDYSGLVAVIRGRALPGRQGGVSRDRIRDARSDFNDACQDLYRQWLGKANWRSPLLVLDEAHHAKNDATRLARLFRGEDEGAAPMFRDKFDRLLFLTATPFQLGHDELIRVLSSFEAAHWSGPAAPGHGRERFKSEIQELRKRLDENRLAGRALERHWARLRREDLLAEVGEKSLEAFLTESLHHEVKHEERSHFAGIQAALARCRETKKVAERDPDQTWRSLHTWVIRHNRPATLPARSKSGQPTARRRHLAGKAIAAQGADRAGLEIAGEAALPFLLAVRAQSELAAHSAKGRALFAEGLVSSYEAFHHTRDKGRPVDQVKEITSEAEAEPAEPATTLVPLDWYEKQIAQYVPSKSSSDSALQAHPKLGAVVDHVVRLWLSGEKVLVFCFYLQTAAALRDHIKARIDAEVQRRLREKLGPSVGSIDKWLERTAERFTDTGSPLQRALYQGLGAFIRDESRRLPALTKKDTLAKLLAAWVRSPSFLALHVPLDDERLKKALAPRETRKDVIQAGVQVLTDTLSLAVDGSSMSLHERLRQFLQFASELAEQGRYQARDDEGQALKSPLDEYLEALGSAQSEEGEKVGRSGFRSQPVVRMVSGKTNRETRDRLTMAFNSPLFPEVLVSTEVMAEGVDLHRFCRHVIHHDLDWNPSVIEQRNGRLDRIRCKAEQAGEPIVIGEPYISGSADERLYRVLKDRERWFQVVMGQRFDFDEATAEQLADRVPLPEALSKDLVFRLSRFEPA